MGLWLVYYIITFYWDVYTNLKNSRIAYPQFSPTKYASYTKFLSFLLLLTTCNWYSDQSKLKYNCTNMNKNYWFLYFVLDFLSPTVLGKFMLFMTTNDNLRITEFTNIRQGMWHYCTHSPFTINVDRHCCFVNWIFQYPAFLHHVKYYSSSWSIVIQKQVFIWYNWHNFVTLMISLN